MKMGQVGVIAGGEDFWEWTSGSCELLREGEWVEHVWGTLRGAGRSVSAGVLGAEGRKAQEGYVGWCCSKW